MWFVLALFACHPEWEQVWFGGEPGVALTLSDTEPAGHAMSVVAPGLDEASLERGTPFDRPWSLLAVPQGGLPDWELSASVDLESDPTGCHDAGAVLDLTVVVGGFPGAPEPEMARWELVVHNPDEAGIYPRFTGNIEPTDSPQPTITFDSDTAGSLVGSTVWDVQGCGELVSAELTVTWAFDPDVRVVVDASPSAGW